MVLVLVCKQNMLFRAGSGKVKSHYPSVPDSSLYLPYLSQMAPGSSEQLGASEAWALGDLSGKDGTGLVPQGLDKSLGVRITMADPGKSLAW